MWHVITFLNNAWLIFNSLNDTLKHIDFIIEDISWWRYNVTKKNIFNTLHPIILNVYYDLRRLHRRHQLTPALLKEKRKTKRAQTATLILKLKQQQFLVPGIRRLLLRANSTRSLQTNVAPLFPERRDWNRALARLMQSASDFNFEHLHPFKLAKWTRPSCVQYCIYMLHVEIVTGY